MQIILTDKSKIAKPGATTVSALLPKVVSSMNGPARHFYHYGLSRRFFFHQPTYKKALSGSIRYYATPQRHAYKSTAKTSAKTAPSKSNIVTSKLAATIPTTKTSSKLHPPPNPNLALNPPSSTRPPILTLPQKGGPDPLYKYYFKLGRAYLTFYKTGLKSIFINYKTARTLANRLFHPLFTSRTTLYAAAKTQRLTRAELQILLRNRADVKVLPLFGLVFICCGEFTPLLVPWLTAIVPPTVHIPLQTKALREKAEKRRQQSRLEGPLEWRTIRNIWDLEPPEQDDKYLEPMFRRLARELALYPPWWEKIPVKKLYMMMIQSRLGKRLSELKYDDLMIQRDGGVKGLMVEEVVMACERRGLAVEGKKEGELRVMLEQWLQDRSSDKAQHLIQWLQGEKVDWKGEGK